MRRTWFVLALLPVVTSCSTIAGLLGIPANVLTGKPSSSQGPSTPATANPPANQSASTVPVADTQASRGSGAGTVGTSPPPAGPTPPAGAAPPDAGATIVIPGNPGALIGNVPDPNAPPTGATVPGMPLQAPAIDTAHAIQGNWTTGVKGGFLDLTFGASGTVLAELPKGDRPEAPTMLGQYSVTATTVTIQFPGEQARTHPLKFEEDQKTMWIGQQKYQKN